MTTRATRAAEQEWLTLSEQWRNGTGDLCGKCSAMEVIPFGDGAICRACGWWPSESVAVLSERVAR